MYLNKVLYKSIHKSTSVDNSCILSLSFTVLYYLEVFPLFTPSPLPSPSPLLYLLPSLLSREYTISINILISVTIWLMLCLTSKQKVTLHVHWQVLC